MTEDPLTSNADDFERALVNAGRRDQMPAERKAALAALLGASTLPIGATATGKSAVSKALLAKWVLGVVAAGAVGVGAWSAMSPPRPTEAATPVLPSATSAPLPSSPPAEVPSPQVPGVVASSLPDAPITSPTVVHPPRPLVSAAPSAIAPRTPNLAPRPSLGEELGAIDRARSALASGNTAEATRALDAYDATFPDGALADEAEVLRIDLLVRKGDRAGARSAARSFLAAHPQSPHAARLRDLLGGTP
jgi:TolA-binding protein